MRYARRMNGYSEVPHNGEINNYLRKDLDAKATAKNTACWNLLGKVRTKRTLCFSLYTALEYAAWSCRGTARCRRRIFM